MDLETLLEIESGLAPGCRCDAVCGGAVTPDDVPWLALARALAFALRDGLSLRGMVDAEVDLDLVVEVEASRALAEGYRRSGDAPGVEACEVQLRAAEARLDAARQGAAMVSGVIGSGLLDQLLTDVAARWACCRDADSGEGGPLTVERLDAALVRRGKNYEVGGGVWSVELAIRTTQGVVVAGPVMVDLELGR